MDKRRLIGEMIEATGGAIAYLNDLYRLENEMRVAEVTDTWLIDEIQQNQFEAGRALVSYAESLHGMAREYYK